MRINSSCHGFDPPPPACVEGPPSVAEKKGCWLAGRSGETREERDPERGAMDEMDAEKSRGTKQGAD